jgi:hypothetical protein
VRNICLLAILLALPETAPAQVGIRAGRNSGPPPSSAAQTDGQSDGRTAVRKDERSRGGSQERSNDRANDGQNDRRNDRRDDRANDRPDGRHAQPRPTTGLSPLGLQPAPTPNLPWWERRQVPAWEQRQTPPWEQRKVPSWEQRQVPAWELTNPTRAAQNLYQQPVRNQRFDGRRRSHRNQPSVVYVLPPYRYFETGTTLSYGVAAPYVTPPPPYEAPAPPPEPLIETGFLKLEVEPRQTLQIFIDGLYIGTLSDLGDELELRLGARRIELRAPGYRTLIFDTQIVPDRTIVYRGALEPLSNAAPSTPAPKAPQAPEAPQAPKAPQASPPQAPQAPVGNRVIYLIPGCYMGNVSPKDIKLRAGCDISKLTTISP